MHVVSPPPPNTPIKLPMQINPRYITKIYSSPRRMPDRVPPMRMRPYYIPERSRTKSENADSSTSLYQETRSIVESVNNSIMMDTCDMGMEIFNGESKLTEKNGKNLVLPLKKAKSLENIRVENLDGSTPSHEMEFVSSRIQKLKVQE